MKLNLRRPVRPLLATAGVAAALVAAGCGVVIESDSAEQLDIIGDVAITTAQCVQGEIYPNGTLGVRVERGDNGEDGETCEAAREPNEEEQRQLARAIRGGSQPYNDSQLLLGYEVPNSAQEPAAFTVTTDADDPTTEADDPQAGEYELSDEYTDALEAEYPSGDDTRWVGYVSTPLKGEWGESPKWTSTAPFGLVGESAGEPYRGPFTYGTAVGYRDIDGEDAAGQPINCEDGDTYCFEDTKGIEQERAPRSARALSSGATVVDTRDLALSGASGPVQITAGTSGVVPFNLRYAGATSPQAFDLAAITSLPGAAATPQAAKFAATKDEAGVLGVTVSVPAGAPAGEQTVELAAGLRNGQIRRGHAKFVVVPAPAAPVAATAPSIIAPPAQSCASRREFTIKLRERKRDPLVSAVVRVNGKKVQTVKRSRITAPVKLTGLPKGRFTVKITAKTRSGKTVTGTRRYRTCTPKREGGVPEL